MKDRFELAHLYFIIFWIMLCYCSIAYINMRYRDDPESIKNFLMLNDWEYINEK